MGDMIKDGTASDVFHQINTRLAPNEPIRELVAIHKEFDMFSGKYSLKQVFRVLHIVPADHSERRRWLRYLDFIVGYKSDQAGVNGHDRIVKAFRENLESGSVHPMFWRTHKAENDERVTVTRGHPIPHERQEYVIISLPTRPAGEAPKPTLAAARVRRAARKK